MTISTSILFLLVFRTLFINDPQPAPARDIELVIDHAFGPEHLTLEKGYTVGNQVVTFTRLKYYVSNVTLRHADGTTWRDTEKYHLVEVDEETAAVATIKLKDVPLKKLAELKFSIGVDSVDNHSGDQEGVLNPDYGMFWMWETGYVFFKVEGYRASGEHDRGAFVYHVGRDNCFRTARLEIPGDVTAQASTLRVAADVSGIFKGLVGQQLRESKANASISVMGGPKALEAADNFVKIFSIAR
ncbi:MAG TPA: MbnP family protein [Chryseolinea sp.]